MRIPKLIQEHRAWVNVRPDSKAPIHSQYLEGASVIRPDDWCDFSEAAHTAEKYGYGLGYVFHKRNIVGIDIDDGYDENGLLTETASDIIGMCESYTEISRSGNGFHILLEGILPFSGMNNRQGVEIYQESRYFIMTGNVLLFEDIVKGQLAIDAIVDKYFSNRVTLSGLRERYYTPQWQLERNGKLPLYPKFPPILEGGRNNAMASLAGHMWTYGHSKHDIYRTLLKANVEACRPPLPEGELRQITNSICRYERTRI